MNPLDDPAGLRPDAGERRTRAAAGAAALIVASALSMGATLPGRTHGLGLITTRLLGEWRSLDETTFAQINLIATLIGSLCCLPCGWLVDRAGTRAVLASTMLLLAANLAWMASATTLWQLAVAITLTRGLGQSMLSVISISMMGKRFSKDAGLPMGLYAVLVTVCMALGVWVLSARVAAGGWRASWWEMSLAIAVLSPLVCALAIPLPREQQVDHADGGSDRRRASATLAKALASPFFWAIALSIALFALVTSGFSLFQQSILAERGLPERVYHQVLIVGLLTGLVANLVGGWLLRSQTPQVVLLVAMLLLASSLAAMPIVETSLQAFLQAVVAAAGGGLLTVLFFAIWSDVFGERHLGKIQGVAQMITVLSSAVGPLVVAGGRAYWGTYSPILLVLAGLSAALGMAGLCVAIPRAEEVFAPLPAPTESRFT